MKHKIIIITTVTMFIFVFLCFIRINMVFNENIGSFDFNQSKNKEKIDKQKIGINTSKFYSDKSPIKLYNRQGVIIIDLNDNYYKIDLKEIKDLIKK